jgi:hypothetical protein
VDRNSGSFEIRGVLPGPYYVIADIAISNNAAVTSMSGATPVDVGETDIENVSVSLTAGFEVIARATVEGNPDSASIPELANVRLGLRALETPRMIGGQQIPQQPVGTFSIRSVTPGNYRVTVEQRLTTVGFIKSIRMNGVDVGDGLRLDGPPAGPIEVVFGTKTATITGTALTATQQPSAGVTVVVTPVRGGMFSSAVSNAQGNFTLTGLPPGDYRIFAFEDIENSAWQNAEYMRPYENRGKALHVEEGARETVHVIAIPAGQ